MSSWASARPAPDLQPHVALFWLTNAVLVAVLFLGVWIDRHRRRRAGYGRAPSTR